MKSKLLAILCVLSLMGWSHAEEAASGNVAAITVGETTKEYATLDEAITAAQSGDTVTLLQDVTESGLTLADKQITLALNGHTIPAGAIVISGSGEVTVTGGTGSSPVSVDTTKGALLTIVEAEGAQTYCTGKLYYNNGELFAQGHALTIEGQDGTDSDTNLRLTYTEGGKSYTTLYTSTTAVRLFAGWKYPTVNTTDHAYTLTMKSGKVQSLRGSNKDKKGGSIASATIVMEGGTADIIASAWYYCPSVSSFTVKISGGKVGTIYGNGETASTASSTIPPDNYKDPTVTEAKIEISGGTVGFVYGGGRALTQADSSANYAMRTVKATIDISGGTVTCVNGGGFNGPEANWSEESGQDQVIVEEAEITVYGGTVQNVFGGGYNGQWKWTYKYHESDGLVFSNYNGAKTTTVRNTVAKSTVNVQEGAVIANLYLGGRSYAYVAEAVANITGGTVGTLSMSGNYGYIAKSTATVTGGQVNKAELLTRNYAGEVALTITGGTVGELYAGVGGAYKNNNSTEKETYNVCTLAVLGSATISAAEGTVSAAYLTTGLEKATAVTCNLPLTVKTMDLVDSAATGDSAYAGTLSSSGHFAIEASTANWQAEIAFASTDESFKPLADTTGTLTYTSLVEGKVVGIAEDLTCSLVDTPPVAQIGETSYASLEAAIAAAKSGDTVTLLQNTQEEALEIGEGANLTIDLGGKTATVTGKTFGTDSESGTSMAAALLNRGTLTLQNGTLKTPDGSTMTALCNTGTLTLLGAKSSTKLYITASQGKVLSSFGGTVSISSGGYANLTGCVAGTTAVIDLYGATLNLYGKVVNSCTTGGMGLALFPRGYTKGGKGSTLMMTGGTLSAYYNAISLNATMGGSSATITGGTVESTGKGAAIYWPYEAALTIGTAGKTIGPTITGGAGILICGGSLTFYGGTITAEAGEFTATAKMLYPFRQYSGSIGLGDAITVVANRGTGYVSAPLNVQIINSSSSKINADNYAVRYLDCNQAKDGSGNPVEQLSQQVTVSISGGIFARTSDAPAVTEGANTHVVDFQYAGNAKVLTGGTFYDESVPAEYCAEGYAAYCATTSIGKQWTVLGSDGADCIAKIGETKYVTLAAALYAVQSGETVTLLQDAPLTTMKLPADATAKTGVVLDLAQHSWYGISLASSLPNLAMTIKNGMMTLKYSPVINGVDVASKINLTLEQVEVTRLSGGTAAYAIHWKGPGKLTLGEGTEISVGTASGIYCYSGAEVTVESGASIAGKVGINVGGTKKRDDSYDAQGVKVQVDGTITATDIGLNVFGSITATEGLVPEIALGQTAQVTSGGVGIYGAGYGKWTVAEGAQMSGNLSGIEMRAGELTVNGGTIKSLAKSYSVTTNGSGTTTVGAGIAVAQHGTKLPLKVKITSGKISGPVALSEANPQGNEAEAISQVALDIQGGTFKAQSAAVVTADCTGFISGGYFSNAVPLAYCATGKVPKTLTAEETGYTAEAPHTVVEPTSANFVAVNADGSAEVYESLAKVPNETKVYIAPSAEEGLSVALGALATTGPADKPRPTTLTVKEAAEVLGGAFTVSKVTNAEGQTTETKLVYHYNFGVAGLEVNKQATKLVLSVVAKLTEGELPANRTLVGRTLQVVLEKGEKGDGTGVETYSVANPVFNEQGECRVAVPWEAMTHGTNAIRVKVVK